MDRISLKNISKSYEIGYKTNKTTLEKIISLFSSVEQKKTLQVLSDVSLDVTKGEILGILGKNGSGKTTLLRIIADIIKPDAGVVSLHGNVIPLIQLGDGMKSRLTLKDNIYLVCTLLGFTNGEIYEKFDSIVAYAGLEKFVYTKWYQFSLGMKQKAVFSIIIHANPDILLLDEVFSAGDEDFRKKSFKDVLNFSKNGCSIVLVGHELSVLEEYCDRVIWIDKGIIKKDGEPSMVINEYKNYGK